MPRKQDDVLIEISDPTSVILTATGSDPEQWEHLFFRDLNLAVTAPTLAVVTVHVSVTVERGEPGTIYLQVDGMYTGNAVRPLRSDVAPASLDALFPLWVQPGEHTLSLYYEAQGGSTSTLDHFTSIISRA